MTVVHLGPFHHYTVTTTGRNFEEAMERADALALAYYGERYWPEVDMVESTVVERTVAGDGTVITYTVEAAYRL